ncbi:uncharacterized protein DFL_001458 [Arthrobotrys flagrans]|uniref:Extracellular membrane protein CFEM domain-containing protein n=1 Tax=Arthrobotrys flagrans TaxID=97331 RepID=A0A437A7P4_ARTFL|nr:hypothetical protein DFL_001458 [Arthrobotrys flagrans]
MRASTLVLASILAVAVSAQDGIPESCARVVTLVQSCVPEDADEDALQNTEIASCLCDGGAKFDTDVVECIEAAGSAFPADVQAFLEGFKGYCSIFSGGGGGGSLPTSATRASTSSATITSSPTETGGVALDSENCRYIVSGLSSCWTDGSTLPTAAPVARCLCSGTSFDAAVEGCYSDVVDSNPRDASTIAALAGYCSQFSAGSLGTGSTPTATDDNSEPTSSGGSDAPDPTSGDEDATTTGRVIQTLDPATTDPATTDPATTGTGSNDDPNSAAGLKVTILGTALAAILAGAALVL